MLTLPYYLDTENAEFTRPIEINGLEGIYNFKDGIHSIAWSNQISMFLVQSNISYEEALKIAENIAFVK